MAITYVGGLSGVSKYGGGITIDLTTLSLSTGDIVVAFFMCPSPTNIDVSISGYTEICNLYGDYQSSQGYVNFYSGYKIMGASPDTSISIGAYGGSDCGNALVVYAIRGVDINTPLDVTPTTLIYSATSPIRPTCPAITPVTSGALVVCGIGNSRAASAVNPGQYPAGYSNLVSNGVYDTRTSCVGVCSKFWSGSGAETPGEWTFNYYAYGGVTIALRPLSSGPANLKSLNTNLKANINSYNTNLIANVKSINTNV